VASGRSRCWYYGTCVPDEERDEWLEYKRDSVRRFRKKRPERILEYQRRGAERTRRLFNEFMAGKCCSVCGESHPACLDWHHRDPKDKKSVAKMINGKFSIENIIAETEKCDLLCSNCHRKLHYEMRTGPWGDHKP
jgi:hypothetical protein